MRILVVDDSAVARIALRGMLETVGFTVVEAGNGIEGLQAFRCNGADVVLCDLFMPDCDGLQMIREVRRADPAVKIIAISGGSNNCKMDLWPTALRVWAYA